MASTTQQRLDALRAKLDQLQIQQEALAIPQSQRVDPSLYDVLSGKDQDLVALLEDGFRTPDLLRDYAARNAPPGREEPIEMFGGDPSPANANANQPAPPGYGFSDMVTTALGFPGGTITGLAAALATNTNPMSLSHYGAARSIANALGLGGTPSTSDGMQNAGFGQEALGIGGFTHADDMFGGVTGMGGPGAGSFGGGGVEGPGNDGMGGGGIGAADPGGPDGHPGDAYHNGGLVDLPRKRPGQEGTARLIDGEFVLPRDVTRQLGADTLYNLIRYVRHM